MHKKIKTTSGILKSSMIVIALVFILALAVNSASAATIDVGSNYTYTTINSAVTAANANDTIIVHAKPSNYNENVSINKAGLTIKSGAGENVTVQTNGGTAFSVINSNGVTIQGFTIQSNSQTTGTGISIGGLYGSNNTNILYNIIQNINTGVSISSSSNNIISNNSFYNTTTAINLGTVSGRPGANNNTVSYNNITNPSYNPTSQVRYGIKDTTAGSLNQNNKYLNNNISHVSQGIYIQQGNITISGNNITIVDAQNVPRAILLSFGSTADQVNVISNNIITSEGKTGVGSIGIYLSSSSPVNANLQIYSNSITNFTTGIWLSLYNPTGTPVTQIYLNRFYNNTQGLVMSSSNTLVNATNNWWGKNDNLVVSTSATPPATFDIYYNAGTLIYNPWIILTTSANPTSIHAGETSTITADLTKNSDGVDTTTLYGGKTVPDGITVTFTHDSLGTINPTANTTNNGISTTTFTAGSNPGTSTINAILDGATVGTNVIIPPGNANVGLTLSDNTTNHRASPGSNVTFTVTAHNNGPYDAHNVVLTINFPTGIVYKNSPDGSFNSATKTLTWNVGTLAAGADATKTFIVQFSNSIAGQNAVLTVNEVQTEAPGSATASDTIHVIGSVLSVTMTDNTVNHQANVGDMVTYTITVHNAGPDDATNVSVKDALNLGLNFISSPDGIYNSSSRAITWDVGTITAGSDFVTTFVAQLTSNFAGKNLNNTVQVKVDNLVKTSASDVFYVKKAVTTVTKTDNTVNHQARVGDLVTYTITVHNAGPDDATNVTLNDILPTGLTFVSSPTGTYNAGTNTITWNVGTITSGSDAVVTFVAQVNNGTKAGRTVKNTVTGTQTEYGGKLSGSDSISIVA